MRRSRSCDTRLAVRLATQPSSNSSRALAMSTVLDSTATPTAETLDRQLPGQCQHASMSWIIRSSTTSMSSERGWKRGEPVRLDELGRRTRGRAALSAGIEPLDLPDLEHASGRAGAPRSSRPPLDRDGHRLLDQHVAAGRQRLLGAAPVIHGGHGDRDRLAPRRAAPRGARTPGRRAGGRLAARAAVAVVNADQLDLGEARRRGRASRPSARHPTRRRRIAVHRASG
jgi:hypothetical protein